MQPKLLTQAMEALRAGQFAPALAAMEAYAGKGPYAPVHYKVRGLAELGLSNWKAAAATFDAAVKKYRDNHDLWAHLGLARQYLGELDEAIAAFERALQLKKENGVASGNLANLYRIYGRYEEAEKLAQHAAQHHPDRPWALNILGLVLTARGKFDAAEVSFHEAMQLQPDEPHAVFNLANNYVAAGDFAAAWPEFAEAQRLSPAPQMRLGEGIARLLTGDFDKGWKLYEARREYPGGGLKVAPTGKRYQGEEVRGKKILIVGEQGFGDVIQFCRFGVVMEKAGAEIFWLVQKPLQRLLAGNVSGNVFAYGDAPPEVDFYIPVMSLPLATGCIGPESWPVAPYLKASEAGPALPDAGTEKKIGLVWAGAVAHEKNHQRNMCLADLEPLLQGVKAQFYAPFIGEELKQAEGTHIIRLDHFIGDFADTAALMKQMDAVVSVDTSAAHLAGALGLRTFLLLPSCPEWRWGLQGDTTPWYPTLTILRQETFGDWAGPVLELVDFMG